MISWPKWLALRPQPDKHQQLKDSLFELYITASRAIEPLNVKEKADLYSLFLDPRWKLYEKYCDAWVNVQLQKLCEKGETYAPTVLNYAKVISILHEFPKKFKDVHAKNKTFDSDNPATTISLD